MYVSSKPDTSEGRMVAVTAKTMNLDALTGLPGYDAFVQYLEAHIDGREKKSPGFSGALVDIDWFGKLNETHGREVGDAVIAHLARHLSDSAGEACTVYRYGGDAFMVLFEETEKEQAFLRMEAIRKAFDKSHLIETHELKLSISVGVAAFPDDANQGNFFLRKCNEALYRAKVSGRNKVSLAREERMVTKTTHYTQGQLEGLSRLAKREGMNEAALLREAIDDLLRKHNS